MTRLMSARRGMLAAACAGAALAAAPAVSPAAVTTFSYTGAEQEYTVPAWVYEIGVSAAGAAGGDQPGNSAAGGKGANVSGYLPVVPGQVLYVYVGGTGTTGQNAPGGFNGGGPGAGHPNGYASGGGASDIRTASNDLASRVLVGAGGGGDGGGGFASGGDGGYPDGAKAPNSDSQGGGGYGGTQSAGGAAGGGADDPGQPGTFGNGGAAGGWPYGTAVGAGGGGGGWYGGGGGGGFAGGGGGSSYYAAAVTDTSSSVASVAQVVIEPVTAYDKDALTFGATPQSTVSAPQTVTFTNTSDHDIRFTGVDFDYANGQNGDDFFVGSTTCAGLIEQDATCVIRVRFNPQAAGARASGLLMETEAASNGVDEPVMRIALSGTGGALPKGDQGEQGEQGAQGDQGVAGGQGDQGAKGDTGAKGTTGDKGANGSNGATGAAGPAGAAGAAGPVGARGPAGAAGVVRLTKCVKHKKTGKESCRTTIAGRKATITFDRTAVARVVLRRGVSRYAEARVVRTKTGRRLVITRTFRKLTAGSYTAR